MCVTNDGNGKSLIKIRGSFCGWNNQGQHFVEIVTFVWSSWCEGWYCNVIPHCEYILKKRCCVVFTCTFWSKYTNYYHQTIQCVFLFTSITINRSTYAIFSVSYFLLQLTPLQQRLPMHSSCPHSNSYHLFLFLFFMSHTSSIYGKK